MRYSTLFSVALFSVAVPFFTTAEHHGPSARRHNALANRKRGDLQARAQSNVRATFYDVGLGACGKVNQPNDFIVALNSAQFGGGFPGPNCFKMITITHNGKTTQAQIMDECPGCPWGGLDMSRGLFTFFEPESVGVFSMDWHFNDGDDGGAPAPKPSPKPKPTSTWTPPKTTSSTWSDPSPWTTSKTKTSSTRSSSSTSSSSSASSSSSSTSHSSSSTSASSSSATPSATPVPIYGTPAVPQNLDGLYALVGELGKFVAKYAA